MYKVISTEQENLNDFEINEDTKAIFEYIRDLSLDYDSAAMLHDILTYRKSREEKKLWKKEYTRAEWMDKTFIALDRYDKYFGIDSDKYRNEEEPFLIFQIDDV